MQAPHRNLVRLLFSSDSDPSRIRLGNLGDPHVPVFVPLPTSIAQAQLVLAPYLTQHDHTVMVCADKRLASVVRDCVKSDRFCIMTPLEFKNKTAPHVVLITHRLSSEDLLRGLSSALDTLTVAFDRAHPPSVLARVCRQIIPHIPSNSLWVNWEPVKQRRREQSILENIHPRNITDLAKTLAEHTVKMLGSKASTSDALGCTAQLLGWNFTPTVEVRPASHPLLSSPLPPALAATAGFVTELIVGRQPCFMSPPAHIILPPACVVAFRKSVRCDDPEFLRAWKANFAYATRCTLREDEWREYMRSWDNVSTETRHAMALKLGRQQPPHTVLPSTVLACRDQIEWATQHYVDPDQPILDERAWWILGALHQMFEVFLSSEDLLHQVCDATQFVTLNTPPRLFRDVSTRTRHLLASLSTVYLDEQVAVTEPHGFRGMADVLVNGTDVLELKLSVAGNGSNEMKHTWPIQAAIYAYVLRKPRAIVYNANTNATVIMTFNTNLYI